MILIILDFSLSPHKNTTICIFKQSKPIRARFARYNLVSAARTAASIYCLIQCAEQVVFIGGFVLCFVPAELYCFGRSGWLWSCRFCFHWIQLVFWCTWSDEFGSRANSYWRRSPDYRLRSVIMWRYGSCGLKVRLLQIVLWRGRLDGELNSWLECVV